MAHSRDRGKKEKRKSPKRSKKGKGDTSPRRQENGTVREIQRHIEELERRQQS